MQKLETTLLAKIAWMMAISHITLVMEGEAGRAVSTDDTGMFEGNFQLDRNAAILNVQG